VHLERSDEELICEEIDSVTLRGKEGIENVPKAEELRLDAFKLYDIFIDNAQHQLLGRMNKYRNDPYKFRLLYERVMSEEVERLDTTQLKYSYDLHGTAQRKNGKKLTEQEEEEIYRDIRDRQRMNTVELLKALNERELGDAELELLKLDSKPKVNLLCMCSVTI
jgi:hypothetical protein